MKNYLLVFSAAVLFALIVGCDLGPKSGRGFVFPEGNIARGQKAFVELNCYKCHRVDGVADLPAPAVAPEKVVLLGGKVLHVRTYGELVTAVIHPNESLTVRPPGLEVKNSPMPYVNETMTVTQMLDIVTFLQPRYTQLEPLYQSTYGR
ncbi:MAG: cytochrome c [Opitutae bacterium]